MIRLAFFAFIFSTTCSLAANLDTSLYILRDSITFENGVKLPYATFNGVNSFDATNAKLEVNLGDQLNLWVVNWDLVEHQFAIKGQTNPVSILPGDSVQVNYLCASPGVFIFYDPTNFPDYSSTGLAGMLSVEENSHQSFYWNIKEHQFGNNDIVFSGGNPDWSNYYPEYFTINGKSNPSINQDAVARIVGNVGDTLMIYIANTGQSIHSLHFHGFHVEIMYSSKNLSHTGRLKDSLPIFPSETLTLRLIPDQPGEYPVHDHNLIGTTGGNLYPQGMFTTMLIAP